MLFSFIDGSQKRWKGILLWWQFTKKSFRVNGSKHSWGIKVLYSAIIIWSQLNNYWLLLRTGDFVIKCVTNMKIFSWICCEKFNWPFSRINFVQSLELLRRKIIRKWLSMWEKNFAVHLLTTWMLPMSTIQEKISKGNNFWTIVMKSEIFISIIKGHITNLIKVFQFYLFKAGSRGSWKAKVQKKHFQVR